jgi:hypothetical protein
MSWILDDQKLVQSIGAGVSLVVRPGARLIPSFRFENTRVTNYKFWIICMNKIKVLPISAMYLQQTDLQSLKTLQNKSIDLLLLIRIVASGGQL